MRIRNFLGTALLLLIAAGAQPALGAFWQWSKTANTNATADPSINWSEGMSPSSINDSARAMMARTAEQRDDMSGLLTTGGTATAYTVTTNQGLSTPTPADGQSITVTVNLTNGASATLQADSGTAYAIQPSAGVAVSAGTLIAGSPYRLRFSVANNAWMLVGVYGAGGIPLGALVPYTGMVAPSSNFVFAAGQCLSTTTYAGYWVQLGSPGIGTCSAGQFRIIDTRGLVLAGLDTTPGFAAAGRLTSVATGCGTAMTSIGNVCANGFENHVQSGTELVSHAHSEGISDPTHGHGHNANTQNSGGLTPGTGAAVTIPQAATINANSTGVRANSSNGLDTTYSAGGSGAMPMIQPTIGVTYLLRVI